LPFFKYNDTNENRRSGIITISGGVVICEAGSGGAAAMGGSGSSGDPAPPPNLITISGGTIITDKPIGGVSGSCTTTSLSGSPVIFAAGIYGKSFDPAQGRQQNGVAIGGKTITITANFTVPAGAVFTIPPGWTVNLNGKTLTNNGTVDNMGTFLLNSGTVNGAGTWNGAAAQP
jgi:hypothetical protein